MICHHCKQDMPEGDMLDDILDRLVERGIALKPSQARKIRDEILQAGITPTMEAT